MITSSWASPVTTWTTHNHPIRFDGSRLVFHGSMSVVIGFEGGTWDTDTWEHSRIDNISDLPLWWDGGIVETKVGSTSLGGGVATSRWWRCWRRWRWWRRWRRWGGGAIDLGKELLRVGGRFRPELRSLINSRQSSIKAIISNQPCCESRQLGKRRRWYCSLSLVSQPVNVN